MKYLKKFEDSVLLKARYSGILGPGVYVSIKTPDNEHSERYNNFLNNHIAEIEDITGNHIYVHFIFNENDSEEIRTEFDYVHAFRLDKVDLYANTIEELITKMSASKYNL